MSNVPLKETINLNPKQSLTISDPSSSTYYPSSSSVRQKKRYEYPFAIETTDSNPNKLNKSKSNPSNHTMDFTANSIKKLTLKLKKSKSNPLNETESISKKHSLRLQLPSLEQESAPQILSLRIPKKEREIKNKIRIPKRRKRPMFKLIPSIPLIPQKPSAPSAPSDSDDDNQTTPKIHRRKWNDIEDIWLKWIYDHIRLKKYEIYTKNVHLPSRFPWSLAHKKFNSYYEYNECFKTFQDETNLINKEIAKYLNYRTEDSIKQHFRNPLWNECDAESRQLYSYQHNTTTSDKQWTNTSDRIKWLYRRAVLHRQLLHKFINTKYYNGKCRGIRTMNDSWLVTYSDLKILRFDSRLLAAQGWDREVRSNHGIIIDSNLPLAVDEYLKLTAKIHGILQEKWSLQEKWLKLKIILIDEYMDQEYGIYPTLQSLLDKLVCVYQWKKFGSISLGQLQRYFHKEMDTNHIDQEFEHFVICMVQLMLKTAEISSYAFTDHWIVPKLNVESVLNANKLMLDDLKYCLFDVDFDLKDILTRIFKYYSLNTINDEEFGPDNAMTLSDCKTLTDSLLNIPSISSTFGSTLNMEEDDIYMASPLDLGIISQKLDRNEYNDVASYIDDLKLIWDNAMTQHKLDHTVYKLAKKYKALCLKKFDLFFEGLTADRRRSKRLINRHNDYDDIDDINDINDIDSDVILNFICPRCTKFEGKNSRSLKTHLRYCKKDETDVIQYCECGFQSHIPQGLEAHQLNCKLNNEKIAIIADNAQITMCIGTEWLTGTIIKHIPTQDIPNLYQIHFRSKGDEPLPYNLDKFNYKMNKKRKRKRNNDALFMKKRRLNDENNPYFIYLNDMSKFRHKLFCKQYDAFQNYVDQWLDDTKHFIKECQ